jgi:molybdate transport system substrate-binding protein
LVGSARLFAHNELVVIVPTANPARIRSFADLPHADRLVIGTANVPVGRYAREAFRRAGAHFGPNFEAAVLASLVSEETNVRLTRTKVELGEADAAVVYATDAIGSDRVQRIPLPQDVNVRADYLIGVVRPGDASELAGSWIDLVLSPEGRDALARRGFVVP